MGRFGFRWLKTRLQSEMMPRGRAEACAHSPTDRKALLSCVLWRHIEVFLGVGGTGWRDPPWCHVLLLCERGPVWLGSTRLPRLISGDKTSPSWEIPRTLVFWLLCPPLTKAFRDSRQTDRVAPGRGRGFPRNLWWRASRHYLRRSWGNTQEYVTSRFGSYP